MDIAEGIIVSIKTLAVSSYFIKESHQQLLNVNIFALHYIQRVDSFKKRYSANKLLEIYQTYQPNVISPSLLLLVLVVQDLVAYIYIYIYIYINVRVHCNTGYCTTLLYNKDVALKGFLHGCRLTRLNHITLVFSVFLLYASPSASTLA